MDHYKCIQCGGKLIYRHTLKTDWYGVLAYYKCRDCKSRQVLRNGELEVAANN